MEVKIMGPNLKDQSKGQFHVHAAGCADLKHYGPGRRIGGDLPGQREPSVEVKDRVDCVEYVYADQISEQPEDEQAQYVLDLLNDLHFFPCVKDLPENEANKKPVGEELHEVYECWIKDQTGSFAKFTDKIELKHWFEQQVDENGVGATIIVGIHSSSEYSNVPYDPAARV